MAGGYENFCEDRPPPGRKNNEKEQNALVRRSKHPLLHGNLEVIGRELFIPSISGTASPPAVGGLKPIKKRHPKKIEISLRFP